MTREQQSMTRKIQVNEAIAKLNELCNLYLEEGEMEQFYDVNADLDVLQSYCDNENLEVEDSVKIILGKYL